MYGLPPVGPASPEQYAAMASSVRQQILRLTLDRDMTNAEIAAELGLTAATTLYHVRKLVAAGLLVAVPGGRGRAIPYRPTDSVGSIDLTGYRPKADAVSQATLDAFTAEAVRNGPRNLELLRFRLMIGDEDAAEFFARLQELINEYAGRGAPDARAVSFIVAATHRPTPGGATPG